MKSKVITTIWISIVHLIIIYLFSSVAVHREHVDWRCPPMQIRITGVLLSVVIYPFNSSFFLLLLSSYRHFHFHLVFHGMLIIQMLLFSSIYPKFNVH